MPRFFDCLLAVTLLSGVAHASPPDDRSKEKRVIENRTDAGSVRFDKAIRKDPCALLTPTMASSVLGVPEPELKQQKVVGCIYTWSNADEEASASLMAIVVQKSTTRAAEWFKNATKDKTQAEVQAEMQEVVRRTKQKMAERAAAQGRELSEVESSATNAVGALVVESTTKDGIRHRDVAGVGDEARVNVNDGTLTVRVDNLVFTVNAYRGKRAPKVELDPKGGMAAIQELPAKTQAANRAWVSSTKDARAEAAMQIAKAIVQGL
jgi:hypothetical protein